MGMTMTQKIFSRSLGEEKLRAGQFVEAQLDLILMNDIMTPVVAKVLEGSHIDDLGAANKAVIVLDHYTPCKDIKSAQLCDTSRKFAKEHGISRIYDVGRMGIEHALLPEEGFIAPGKLIIGADSHTCTAGALGAFATGVGSTDVAAALATGSLWFQIPSAIRVELIGNPGKYIGGKDVILQLIGMIGVDGATYKSLEFTGDGIARLDMDDRFTICNMAIEAGAKNAVFPVDSICRDYQKSVGQEEWDPVEADIDASYEQTIVIDLSSLKPTVAMPHLPSNTRLAGEVSGVGIQQVVIGSCTNGRLKDLSVAAELLKGHRIHPGVRCIVIPATQKIYRDAMQKGLIEIFLEAGAVVSTPTCGPCCGGYMGVLAEGECCVSTTNRNFVGRMGHMNSAVILAGPAVAAASAITGVVTDPNMLVES